MWTGRPEAEPGGLGARAAVGAGEGRLDRRVLVDPAAAAVAVDRRGAEIAGPGEAGQARAGRRRAGRARDRRPRRARSRSGRGSRPSSASRPAAAGRGRREHAKPGARERRALRGPARGAARRPSRARPGGGRARRRSSRGRSRTACRRSRRRPPAPPPTRRAPRVRLGGVLLPQVAQAVAAGEPAERPDRGSRGPAARRRRAAAAATGGERRVAAVADGDQHVADEAVAADPLDRAAGEAPAERGVVEGRELGQRRRGEVLRAPGSFSSAAARANLFQGQTARQSSQP